MSTRRWFLIYSATFQEVTTHLTYIFGNPVKFPTQIQCRNCTYDFRSKHTSRLIQNVFQLCRQRNVDAPMVFNLFDDVLRDRDALYLHFRKASYNVFMEKKIFLQIAVLEVVVNVVTCNRIVCTNFV